MEFLSNNFISDFFVIVLKWVFSWVNEYSVAIILVTIAIRLLILPLDLKQKKSSRKMALVQPKLESLKKRYANNPQQMQKKQKELYAQEGVRPLAGCLPMLITLPLFFAFFGAMRVLAAEQQVWFILNAQNIGEGAYQLPSWLWVNNFWQPDSGLKEVLQSGPDFVAFIQQNSSYINPQALHMLREAGLVTFDPTAGLQATEAYTTLASDIINFNGLASARNGWFILPILAGGSLFLQQKISMKQNPSMQKQGKMMLYIFPLFSVYICVTASAAFSVYWLAANIYALGQVLILNYIYKKRDEKAKEGIVTEGS
ncbi:MAG: YidC/Oxa1 family membrane protein insertase [Clostridia bacterium]|nr:YidC/Oxa1 family membrane protein insertase [Clostridia bacterium]MBT7122323.1 YidC/Oxa1 family membrane protein insertase [Clostridia bacterium]